jgi:glycine betaine/proline transport system permease protein
MASYDFLFNSTGLEGWCDTETSSAPTSMADLLAAAKGEEVEVTVWDFPFPSLDALNESCGKIPETRDLTKGLEDGFLAIKDALRFVLDPITEPLSWMLDGALYLAQVTPWWIVIPLLLLVTHLISKSWSLTIGVGASIMGLAFIDHYSYAIQTLSIIFVCAAICVLLGEPIGIAMSRSDR